MLRVLLLLAVVTAPAVFGAELQRSADNLRAADKAFFAASIGERAEAPLNGETELLQTRDSNNDPSVSVSLVGELTESKAKATTETETELENRRKDVELENAALAQNARSSDDALEARIANLVGRYHGGLTAEERVRNQDLEIAQALTSSVSKHAGAHDLGAGAVGGNLVKTLLGNSIKLSDNGWQTVFNHAKARAYHKFWSLVSKKEAAKSAKKAKKDKKESRIDVRPASTSFLIPFLRFYQSSTKDHVGSTDPYEFSDRLGDYSFQGIVAFIWSRQDRTGGVVDPDQVPLYRYWDRSGGKSNHFFSVDSKRANGPIIRQGIAGFVYNQTRPGLVALNEYKGDGDSMYSISSAASLKFNGVTYKKVGRVAFVHPLVQKKTKLPKAIAPKKKAKKDESSSGSGEGNGSGSGSHNAAGVEKVGPRWFSGQSQWEDLSK